MPALTGDVKSGSWLRFDGLQAPRVANCLRSANQAAIWPHSGRSERRESNGLMRSVRRGTKTTRFFDASHGAQHIVFADAMRRAMALDDPPTQIEKGLGVDRLLALNF